MPVDEVLYPVSLVLAGRRCLVVGGGPVAARKAEGLLRAGALVHVVAVRVGPEVRRMEGLSWEERPWRGGELAGYRLVMAATDDHALNQSIYAEGEEVGAWVNCADDPISCSFLLPSVVRRGPITVAVSTGGHSPALAAWLRRRLAEELGPEYEVLVGLLSAERDALKAAGRPTEGPDWQRALSSDMLELIRAGYVEQARELLRACLSSS